jgi:hypothetical protein
LNSATLVNVAGVCPQDAAEFILKFYDILKLSFGLAGERECAD